MMKRLVYTMLMGVFFLACANKSNQQQTISVPTEDEIEEFSEAAEKVMSMLQPKTVKLVFSIKGEKYTINAKTVKPTIIPFVYLNENNDEMEYEGDEPENEEESHSTTAITMVGDLEGGVQNLVLELSVPDELSLGEQTCVEGNIIISESSENGVKENSAYWSVRNLNLKVTKLEKKVFMEELKGYSLTMSFSGQVKNIKSKETAEIDGVYEVLY